MQASVEIVEDLKTLVAKIIEVDREALTPATHFINDLDMDSLMSLDLLTALEKKNAIRIPEEALPEFATLQGVVDVVTGLLVPQPD